MTKRFHFVLLITVGLMALSGCTSSANEATTKQPSKKTFVTVSNRSNNGSDGGLGYDIVVDQEAKVQYIIVRTPHGVSMTPRLHSDGSVYKASP